MPTHAFVSASSIFVYALPYILFTRNPYTSADVKVDKKSDTQSDTEKAESINMKRFFNIQNA
jgi:hypothetical protein